MKLSELAENLHLDIVRVERDCEISHVALCSDAAAPRTLTYLEKEKFLPMLENTSICAVICSEELVKCLPPQMEGILVTCAPKYVFYAIYNQMTETKESPSVSTRIGENARIASTAWISPTDVVIGNDVVIEPGVVIQPHVTIGDRVHIGANTVVGSGSFSPVRYQDRAITMKDLGRVLIGDDVEIRSLCSIERGVFENDVTVLERGVKIDQQVLVGHGTHIGQSSFIVGCAYIAGNCVIGANVWIGGNATISNRIRIGDSARVSLGSVVTKDVPAGQTVSGNFAIAHQAFLRNLKRSLQETEN